MPKKIIVTGGAGFIASHVADAYVAAGHQVVIIDNLLTGFKKNINKKAKFYHYDIFIGSHQLFLSLYHLVMDHVLRATNFFKYAWK